MCKCLNLDSFLLHSQERRAENKLLQPKGRKERKRERRRKRNKKENKKKMKKTNLRKLWNYKKMMMKKKTMMKVKNKCFYEQCSCGVPPLPIKVKESVWKLVSGIDTVAWQNSFAQFFTPSFVHKSLSLLENLQLNWQLSKEHNSSCSVFSEGTDFPVLWVLIVHKLLFFQWSKKFP